MTGNNLKNVPQNELEISFIEKLHSPFYNLIDILNRYNERKATNYDLEKALRKAIDILTGYLEEETEKIEDIDIRMEMVVVLESIGELTLDMLGEIQGEEGLENTPGIINKLEEYNERYLGVQKKAFPEKHKENRIGNLLTCEIFKNLPCSELLADNFQKLESVVKEFEEAKIDERKYMESINKLSQKIEENRKELENQLVAAGEWDIEISAGDRLLMEGLNDWEKAIALLSDIFSHGYEKNIKEGMALALLAETKLKAVRIQE